MTGNEGVLGMYRNLLGITWNLLRSAWIPTILIRSAQICLEFVGEGKVLEKGKIETDGKLVFPLYYICIDKACLVLHTCVANGSWEEWKKTTRFIVDSYHINHSADDILCRTWCNPAPTDGSAPNLVIPAVDKNRQACFKRAFNTQVS